MGENMQLILQDTWIMNRFKVFTEKVDSFKGHDKYDWLRNYADRAICKSLGSGLVALAAKEFIRRIETMPQEYIKGWLDGENDLEWKERSEVYENRSIA